MQDFMQFLEERKSKLSKSHRLIADYMLNNYDKAAFMTAARLGSVVGISESTVIRFAITLGFDGYPELQDALMKAAHNKMTVVQRMEVTKSRIGTSTVLKNVLHSDMETIRMTLENIDTETFDCVVDSIINAKRIYIVGVRSSSALAEFLGFYFNLMFNSVRVVGTSGVSEVAEQVFHICEDDVLIGISYPRYSNRTLKALKYASGKKCYCSCDNRQFIFASLRVCEIFIICQKQYDSIHRQPCRAAELGKRSCFRSRYKKRAGSHICACGT